MDIVRDGFVAKELFLKEMHEAFNDEEEFFTDLTMFKSEKLIEYKILLEELIELDKKKASDKKERIELTRKKGKSLEEIVKYIIKNSVFFDIYDNVRTSTNEIDEVVSISYKGRRIMDSSGISVESLGIEGDYFLGECKNYNKKVGSTWVGKFYTLLKTCGGCRFGILFSFHGLSGQEDKRTSGQMPMD